MVDLKIFPRSRPFRALWNALAVAVIGVMAMGFGVVVVLWIGGVGE